MRPVLIGDVIAAARVLVAQPHDDWDATLGCLLAGADLADAFRQHQQAAHPVWGDGSLMSATANHPSVREPFLSDPRYLCALREVIDALIRQKHSFVSCRTGLYRSGNACDGDVDHGRNTHEDGSRRSGLAADL